MARARKFTHSVILSLVGQAITMTTGLWLSPFLLAHLGKAGFGFWIVGQQLLTYLALIDLGVVALLPREIGWATGRPDSQLNIPVITARTFRILAWQFPLVASMAAGLVWLVAFRDASLFVPVAVAAASIAAVFLLRVFRAVLEGLQDFAFVGTSYMAGWFAGVVLSVAMVLGGSGLTSLPAGWAMGQLADAALCAWRVRKRFAFALPSLRQLRQVEGVREQFGRGLWISVSQVSQVLIYGTDAAVIGRLFGVAVVVPYSCTGKLINVLANQPQMIMRAAEPGLSEMRTAEKRGRLTDVTGALSLAMLIVSGAVAVFTVAANPDFVRWWMGADNYSGLLLTVLFAVSMSLRHLNVTAIYTLFAFGQERFLAMTSLADGILSTAFSIALGVVMHSTSGVVLGSILSTCCVLFFGNAKRLGRELSVSEFALAKPILGWFWRMLLAGAAACFLGSRNWGSGPIVAGVLGGVALVFYGLLMTPVALRSSLRPYLIHRWNAVRASLGKAPSAAEGRL